MKKTPDYLTEGDGHTDVTLSKPLTLDGAAVTSLRMREPTVDDQLASQNGGGLDADKELALFANLCEVSPKDLGKLPLRDYKRVQTAFLGFID